jgi:hypothetical protein
MFWCEQVINVEWPKLKLSSKHKVCVKFLNISLKPFHFSKAWQIGIKKLHIKWDCTSSMYGKKMCGSFIEMITLFKGEFVSRGPALYLYCTLIYTLPLKRGLI